ncbi:MAG TPA: argininosuccinate synthase [Gaiellaceae bacterium]|nr:argininosuccinate synthase [Gaiellaceae bacterium]
MTRTAVVAYSGGLDTSCILAWLKEDWYGFDDVQRGGTRGSPTGPLLRDRPRYGFDEVVAVLVDVGQEFDLEESIVRAKAAEADDVLLVDRKDAFADEQCARAIVTNALYEGKYPLVSALSRPVIAQAVAEIALELGAEAVVHGCTGKGNDQLRFELAFKAHYPGVKVIAPLRDRIWTRDEEIEYAIAKGIPVVQSAASPYSIDENLFGRAIEAGVLEDPWNAPPDEPYALTSDPTSAPSPVEVVVGFEHGIPVSLDGEELSLSELIARANRLAGAYGIGRIDMIENRVVGIKSREVYEAPGAITLITAHSALEDVVLTKDEARLKRPLEQHWTELVYDGLWFSPAREAIDAFVDSTQLLVTGEVRLELRPNAAVVTGRRAQHALYAAELASYGNGETFPHDAAEGFIRISALETELHAARARAKSRA